MKAIIACVGVVGMVGIALAHQGGGLKPYDLVYQGGPLGPHLRQAARSCKELMSAAKILAGSNPVESNPRGLNRGLGRIEGRGLTLDDLASR